MVRFLVEYLQLTGKWSRSIRIKFDYILNDTSSICLGTGQSMLRNYFVRRFNKALFLNNIIRIHKPFPENMNQIKRLRSNSGVYDIIIFSYVLSPLMDDKNFKGLIKGFLDVESFCDNKGRILIIQDKYQKPLIHKISQAIGISNKKEESHQYIFPQRNDNETYNYSYYSCLYTPKIR